jgi:hypothetical protein
MQTVSHRSTGASYLALLLPWKARGYWARKIIAVVDPVAQDCCGNAVASA